MAIGVVLVVFCGGWVLVIVHLQRACLMGEVREGGLRLAETVRRSLRYAMLHDDRAAIEDMVRTIGDNDDLSAVRVVAKTGRVMFSSRPGDQGRRIGMDDPACRGCHGRGTPVTTLDPADRAREFRRADGTRVFQWMDPIRNEPACSSAPCHVHPPSRRILGVLELEMSLDHLEARLAANRARLFGVSAGMVLAVCLAVFWLVHRLVARRIALLAEGTRRIAAGDLDHRIPDLGQDEVGNLAGSFNTMARTLRETRDRLVHADRLAALGRLAAGVAHELNNPLTAVMMFASALAAEKPDPGDRDGALAAEKRQAALRAIVDEAGRCRDIIRGLLDFARQEPPRKVVARVEGVVNRAIQVVAGQGERLGIPIEKKPGADVPDVEMDPAQIQQVLVNLLANALDATVEAGAVPPPPVTVSWGATEDGRIEISVRDQGTGIAPEHLGRIFEPFFSTRGRKGTGLGLSIAWGIMERHQGDIQVWSEVGKGSVFVLRLPVRARAESTAIEREAPVERTATAKEGSDDPRPGD